MVRVFTGLISAGSAYRLGLLRRRGAFWRPSRARCSTDRRVFSIVPVGCCKIFAFGQRSSDGPNKVRHSLCSSSYQSSQPPIGAVPTESVTYGFTHWPVRQANHETSGHRACSCRQFAADRGSNCPKRERSWDASSDGTCLAPRRQRDVKLSGVWLPHPGPCCLLPAVGKQQICCRIGTFSATDRVGNSGIDRCVNRPPKLHVGHIGVLGLPCVFLAEILNLLRRQAYQVLLIRMTREALRTSPQPEGSLFRINFGKIHWNANSYASDFRLSRIFPRLHFNLALLCAVSGQVSVDRDGIQLRSSNRDAIRTVINSDIDRTLAIICTKSETIS